MAAASSSSPFFGIREEEFANQMKQSQPQQQQQPSSSAPSSSVATAQASGAPKKKRNLPGTPNPDAEVIALSPKTLMATNRFICEVCNKGFQREQNLQLHRRGHNLPWKLRQKSSKEVQRRKVYLCPEPTCVHHDPSRALGDLTGIKKHFSRKHGEKKWKCDKCSKRYAVQSDWKAHSKICGTREYRCDCGTLFSRRDSFITHRAFCDALAQESARIPTSLNTLSSHLYGNSSMAFGLSQMNSQLSSLHDQTHPSPDLLRLGGGGPGGPQFDHSLISPSNASSFRPPPPLFLEGSSNQAFHEDSQTHHSLLPSKPFHGLLQLPDLQSNQNNSSSGAAAAAANLFNLGFLSSNTTSSMNSTSNAGSQNAHLIMPDQFNGGHGNSEPSTLFAGNIMNDHLGGGGGVSTLFNTPLHNEPVLPQMSATALLQKAAQMGATTSSNASSLLRGFGSSSSGNGKSTSLRASFAATGGGGGGGGGESLRSHMENENHFQDLMSSFTNGGGGMFGGSAFGGSCTGGGGVEQETNGFGGYRSGLDEGKLHHSLSARSIGGSDTLTRDFLGVGSIVRSMGDGMSQREHQQHHHHHHHNHHHHGIDIGSLSDSDMKSPSSARSFAGGSLQ